MLFTDEIKNGMYKNNNASRTQDQDQERESEL